MVCFIAKHARFFGKDMSKLSTFCIANTFFRKNACFIKYIHYLCNVFHSEVRPQGFTIKNFRNNGNDIKHLQRRIQGIAP